MTSSESCYDGLLGQCRNCGDNGNCQCGWSMNGHNDLLPMDRRRFGGNVLMCPISMLYIYLIHGLSLFFSVALAPSVVNALRSQAETARQQRLHLLRHRPIRLLLFLSLALLMNAAFSLTKMVEPSLLLGVDWVPTAFYVSRVVAINSAGLLHVIHCLEVYLTSREFQEGREEVQLMLARQSNMALAQFFTSDLLAMSPLVGAGLVKSGHNYSRELQQYLTVGFLILECVRLSASSARWALSLRGVRTLFNERIASLDQEIEMARFAYDVAKRGDSLTPYIEGVADGGGAPLPTETLVQRLSRALGGRRSRPSQPCSARASREQPSADDAVDARTDGDNAHAHAPAHAHEAADGVPEELAAEGELSESESSELPAEEGMRDSFRIGAHQQLVQLRKRQTRLKGRLASLIASNRAGILAVLPFAFLYLLFAAVPKLWTAVSYLVALQCLCGCEFFKSVADTYVGSSATRLSKPTRRRLIGCCALPSDLSWAHASRLRLRKKPTHKHDMGTRQQRPVAADKQSAAPLGAAVAPKGEANLSIELAGGPIIVGPALDVQAVNDIC
mmetsp:Transcript_5928/g.13009  ORF Transcript_5928/g.13009 Transcript_5928/m.13009 type:complete len:561 (-) Transcript_5928:489-2171(-)